MTTEERLALLEKKMAELEEKVPAQPRFAFQSSEKLVSITIMTDKRKYKIEAD